MYRQRTYTPQEIVAAAKSEAATIIQEAKAAAKIIQNLAYEQGMALAERSSTTPEEREADLARAKQAVSDRIGRQRLNAASYESAGHTPINIKPAHRLENVEYLISQGCPVPDALERSGYKSFSSFERAAYRHQRNDLVRTAKERFAA